MLERGQLTFRKGRPHYLCAAAGFSVVAFKPLPQSEDIIRSNLCINDTGQERVTFGTEKLGAVSSLCKENGIATMAAFPAFGRGGNFQRTDGLDDFGGAPSKDTN